MRLTQEMLEAGERAAGEAITRQMTTREVVARAYEAMCEVRNPVGRPRMDKDTERRLIADIMAGQSCRTIQRKYRISQTTAYRYRRAVHRVTPGL